VKKETKQSLKIPEIVKKLILFAPETDQGLEGISLNSFANNNSLRVSLRTEGLKKLSTANMGFL
jgi:hypothetical protein